MNIRDIIIIAIVLILVIIAIFIMIKRKKSGKYLSCGGDCSHCASHDICRTDNDKKD